MRFLDTHISSPLCRFLRDTRGFMLAEQLVSIIFIGLLCIVVTAGLSAAMSAYSSITTQTKADALLAEAVEKVSDELVYSLEVLNDEEVQHFPEFNSASLRERVGFNKEKDARGIWLNRNGPALLLVSAENNIVPILADLVYNGPTSEDALANSWTFTIEIRNIDGSKPGNTTYAQATMTVKRIG